MSAPWLCLYGSLLETFAGCGGAEPQSHKLSKMRHRPLSFRAFHTSNFTNALRVAALALTAVENLRSLTVDRYPNCDARAFRSVTRHSNRHKDRPESTGGCLDGLKVERFRSHHSLRLSTNSKELKQ
jgi:hypothetical protein